jgi:bifunctional DNA-binding transcriptional regulator/antitoxin component of YhaV-PrlF toxin-antitoxin module
MQVTTKGQFTIPQEIRNRLGLLPHTNVAFELAGESRSDSQGRTKRQRTTGARCPPQHRRRPHEHGPDHGADA